MKKKTKKQKPKKQKTITGSQFIQNAKPIDIEIDGQKLTAELKSFATGSLGWALTHKSTINIPNVGDVEVQTQINMVITGSK